MIRDQIKVPLHIILNSTQIYTYYFCTTFTISTGDRVALLGRNGCRAFLLIVSLVMTKWYRKPTLLKVLNKRFEHTFGDIMNSLRLSILKIPSANSCVPCFGEEHHACEISSYKRLETLQGLVQTKASSPNTPARWSECCVWWGVSWTGMETGWCTFRCGWKMRMGIVTD
jgi:hypothetical protein